MSKKKTAKDQILEMLADGRQKRQHIIKATGIKADTVKKALSGLVKAEKVEPLGGGWYALPAVVEGPDTPEKKPESVPTDTENLRGEAENIETINKMLDAYDLVLDDIVFSLKGELATKATIEAKIDLIKSLRWVAATIDQLMKRWYLVHRGYDSNTRQAVEDAKQKTSDREKQALEDLPPEEQLEVVGDYDVEMRKLLEALPEPVQKKVTV